MSYLSNPLCSGTSLWIDIDDCGTDPGLLGGHGQVNAERGLSGAPLLLHKCNPSHGWLPRIVQSEAPITQHFLVCLPSNIIVPSPRVTRDARVIHHASTTGQAHRGNHPFGTPSYEGARTTRHAA